MTLLPLTPLDLPTFAALIRNGGEIACDWLMERFADLGVDPAGQQATGDVLLLYARDDVACEGCLTFRCPQCKRAVPLQNRVHWESLAFCLPCQWSGKVGDTFYNPHQLLAAHFTEPLLARWLGMVGDGRAEDIEDACVSQALGGQWGVYGPRMGTEANPIVFFPTESAARLDLKRRVLGLFGEMERPHFQCWIGSRLLTDWTVEDLYHQIRRYRMQTGNESVSQTAVTVEAAHPINFLPVQTVSYTAQPGDRGQWVPNLAGVEYIQAVEDDVHVVPDNLDPLIDHLPGEPHG